MLDPEFGLHGLSATTMGATPAVIVNGPARHEAGLNSAAGALQVHLHPALRIPLSCQAPDSTMLWLPCTGRHSGVT